MITFNALQADDCWFEQEQTDVMRAGAVFKTVRHPAQLFIKFEGTESEICAKMGVAEMSEWNRKEITVKSGDRIAVGRIIGHNQIVTEHEHRNRVLGGAVFYVPAKYNVTYYVTVEKLIILER